jgi:Flp pilus assembly pilin Flp
MLNTLRNVWNDESGVTGSEYAMLVGLVSLVAIFALTEINAKLQDLLNVQMQDNCTVVQTDVNDTAKSVDTVAIP